MAQLQSLGIPPHHPSPLQHQNPPTSLADSFASLGMYKNFLGAAAAGNSSMNNSAAAASMLQGQHFLAALMGGNSSGQQGKQKK